MKSYDHKTIEAKWQEKWRENKQYRVTEETTKEKCYVLDMFPYPSGEGLHVGHPKGYIASDVYARHKSMQGYNVLHPMGWDAFGLPAENFAIKHKVHPRKAVEKNVARFKEQLEKIGFTYDWEREINTTDPEYYKWTQWIFLQLHKKGLAYESYEPINWCPGCKTGLANEDLVDGNRCERCDSVIEKKPMRQWVLRITDYADRMLQDLDELPWSDSVKTAQQNWIGKSEGSLLRFEVKSQNSKGKSTGQKVKVLILHGTGGDSKENWFPWLKSKLETLGAEVVVPDLPDSDVPVFEKWLAEAEKHMDADIIIGHSLGAVLGQHLAARSPKKVSKLILVAPPHVDMDWTASAAVFGPELVRTLKRFLEVPVDHAAIERNVQDVCIYHSDNDPYILPQDFDLFPSSYTQVVLPGKGHLNASAGCDTLPELLEVVEDVIASRPPRSFSEVGRNDEERGETKQSSTESGSLRSARDDKTDSPTRPPADSPTSIEVFTTRADTLYGATYLVLAPEHGLVAELLENKELGIENYEEVQNYVEKTKKKKELERKESKEKTGVELKGVKAINPGTQEEIPVWIADYVLANYGTGAIMAVPAHDERDGEFAKKFGLSVRTVIADRLPTHAGALLESKQRPGTFLFQKRGADAPALPGKIALFGGGIEPGETVHEGLTRELAEELELVLQSDAVTDTYTYPSTVEGCHVWVAHVHGVDENKLALHEGEAIVPMTLADARAHPDLSETVRELIGNIIDGRVHAEQGVLIESGIHTGLTSIEAKTKITEHVGGKVTTQYRLQDWVFSRQRYWGEPIPIIHCEACGAVPVPEEQLPVLLPEVDSYEPTGTGESPLANISSWVNTTCPTCKGPGKRETNTMPQWAGSSWYYLRYMDPRNQTALVGKDKEKYWAPVDVYVGGMEHATRHLIYARFWHKFLYDIGIVSTKEPFQKLYTVGLIEAEDGRKMSKRWGNVINPDDVVAQLGADVLRIYEMFMGPFGQAIAWNTNNTAGARRFLEKVYGIKESTTADSVLDDTVTVLLQQTIKKVGADIETFSFNTAISQLMVLTNALEKLDAVPVSTYETLIRLLAPFAPHLTEELWQGLGHATSVHLEPWPTYDEAILASAQVTIAVQVQGKTRGTFTVAPDTGKEAVLLEAKGLESVMRQLEGKEIVKEIYVPGRLVNFVVR